MIHIDLGDLERMPELSDEVANAAIDELIAVALRHGKHPGEAFCLLTATVAAFAHGTNEPSALIESAIYSLMNDLSELAPRDDWQDHVLRAIDAGVDDLFDKSTPPDDGKDNL